MEKFISTNKKAQVWGLDLMIGVMIVLVGIISIYFYTINVFGDSQTILKGIHYDGDLISTQILSEGSPPNWTNENVRIPGILTNDKINQTKLDRFYNHSNNNYRELKQLLGTTYEFYFNFSEIEVSHIGKIKGIGKEINNPDNLIKLERYTLYKNKPVKFNLYIWN